MPSPFPGMDPWLEDPEVFPNLHGSFLIELRNDMNAVLPKGYVAAVYNRVYVDEDAQREPDVSIFNEAPSNGRHGGMALAAYARTGLTTFVAERASDPTKEIYLQILSSKGKRLVTAIEMLSPTNKTAGKKGRDVYLEKQQEYLSSEVNLVELDLLRYGKPATAFPESRRPSASQDDYHASIVTFENRCLYSFLPIPLRKPLPTLPVPLDKGMEPLFIPMQPIFERCYKGGRYEELVDYDEPCRPLLTPEHEAWANELLRTRNVG